jgi:hypothetical protein
VQRARVHRAGLRALARAAANRLCGSILPAPCGQGRADRGRAGDATPVRRAGTDKVARAERVQSCDAKAREGRPGCWREGRRGANGVFPVRLGGRDERAAGRGEGHGRCGRGVLAVGARAPYRQVRAGSLGFKFGGIR